jgi:hypothetical protein
MIVSQRGIGRSWPSFYHKECNPVVFGFAERDDDGKYNATGLKDYLDNQKDYVQSCWGCTDCDYQFNIEQPGGDVRSFHFLECKSIIVFYYFLGGFIH